MKNVLTQEDIAYREQIHLRNLKRRYAKLSQYPELTDEALKIRKEIQSLE
ncbi:hypothetical protein [Methanobrevibacter sp. V14]|nr:hypothetical protein [Methanobrevibacter sp. V14]